MVPNWNGEVKGCRVEIDLREQFERHLIPLEGKRVVVTVKIWRKPRSTGQFGETGNQNGYYWAVPVRMIADQMGITDDEAHDFLRHKFLKRGVEKDGRRFEVAGSTKDLSAAEFEDYCSKIRTWAGSPGELCEAGCFIPEPNEADWSPDMG